ncbi:MAG: TonB-dependent receptor [Acidobacteria bacterium]|nr:TonB-dependent receptor [Acidobacteriota bacterium]
MFRFQTRNLSWIALAVVAVTGQAQELTGTFVGTVKNKKGGVSLPGVQVRLTSPALMGTRTVMTDPAGNFRAPLLPPGSYTATITHPGFYTTTSSADVGLGQVVRQDILLVEEREAGTVVEVVATQATVDKTDVKVATLVSSEAMDLMPRTTRGLEDMAMLAPGVISNVNTNNRLAIRGSQTTGNRVLLNGTDISDNTYTGGNGRQYFVDDSIQEMQVIQSPIHARYGNFTGGVLNAITRSGGNDFTGVFRALLARPSWSAQAPRGDRATLAPSNAGTALANDILSRAYSLTLGGPILKDRLWFQIGTKAQPATYTAGTIASPGSTVLNSDGSPRYVFPDEGSSYTTVTDTKFYELKLTFAATQNHTFEVGQSRQTQNTTDYNFTAANIDRAGLCPSINIAEYRSIMYRGVFGSSLTGELKLAEKKSVIQSGGDGTRQYPMLTLVRFNNTTTPYRFNNATFDNEEIKHRDNSTLSGNLTWFGPTNALGSHTLDLGFERMGYSQAEPNRQQYGPARAYVNGINPDRTYRMYRYDTRPTGVPDATYLMLYVTADGRARSTQTSFYINDLWSITDRWQVMAGLRYDKAHAEDTFGSPTVDSSKISPRFQVTWDINGDQRWLARAHHATYVGALHSGFVNKFTYASNPYTEVYAARANNFAVTYAQLSNLSTSSPVWDISPAGFEGASGGPTAKVDRGITAPSATESSINLRHTYANGSFLSLTYAQRNFKDFYNDFTNFGNEYSFMSPFSGVQLWDIRTFWKTDDRIKRTLKTLELELNLVLNRDWSLGGNWSYSVLRGNGEGSDSTATSSTVGDRIGDLDELWAAKGIPVSEYYPEGYLRGDVRNRGNLWLGYNHRTASRATYYGSLMLNYFGGSPWSLTRTLDRSADVTAYYNSYAAANPGALHGTLASYLANGAGWTRFFGQRGFMRDNDYFNFDLKLGYEMALAFKVRVFTELTVLNVFNHWQETGYRATNGGTTGTYGNGKDGFLAMPWTPGTGANAGTWTGFGTKDFNDFTGGRVVRLSLGFKW